jgi:hypothetical protein
VQAFPLALSLLLRVCSVSRFVIHLLAQLLLCGRGLFGLVSL